MMRLDALLVERTLAPTRAKAQGLILAGEVMVDGRRIEKPGHSVARNATLQIKRGPPFVSRGGEKLDAALDRFDVDVKGKTALDIGASTGGFSDCLLKRGARKVYALDVGYGQLDPKLRADPRVVVIERANIRHVDPRSFTDSIDLVTIDVSFISLTKVLPKIREIVQATPTLTLRQAQGRLLPPQGGGDSTIPPPLPVLSGACGERSRTVEGRGGGQGEGGASCNVIALIKPQFEVGPKLAPKGIVRDPHKHDQVIEAMSRFASEEGFRVLGVAASPLKGAKGNREFFIHLSMIS